MSPKKTKNDKTEKDDITPLSSPSVEKKAHSPQGKTEKTKPKKESSTKKNTSLRLEKKTLKSLKIRAIEEDTSVQKLVEKLIEAYLNTPR